MAKNLENKSYVKYIIEHHVQKGKSCVCVYKGNYILLVEQFIMSMCPWTNISCWQKDLSCPCIRGRLSPADSRIYHVYVSMDIYLLLTEGESC